MSLRSILCLLSVVAAQEAFAGGYAINEQGARATGKAGAFVAEASDPSAITYNPAGLAGLEGVQAYVGMSLVAPSVSFTEQGSGRATKASLSCTFASRSACSDKLAPIPNLYLSDRLSPGNAIGIGVTAPFGLGLRWPWADDSPERFEIREQALSTLFISPVAALDASPYLSGLSVAIGFDVVPAHVFLRRDIALGEGEGSLRIGGDAVGAGGRLGILYVPPAVPGVRLGLTWRSPVTLDFHGLGDFEVKPGTPRSALPADGKVTTQLTLPQSAAIGLAYNLSSWLGLEADAEWFDWSVMRKIKIHLPDGSTSTSDKSWHDTFALRLGLTLGLGPLTIRGGVAYDRSPVPATRLDPSLPDGDRILVAGGLGVALPGPLRFEIAGLYAPPITRNTSDRRGEPSNKGTYHVSIWALSAGLGIALENAPDTAPAETK